MKSRKILGQSGAIALMFALVFTPLALATDEVPQSGPGDADSPGLNSNTDESAVTEPLEHVDLADQATEGEEEAVPSFDATYVDLIIDAVEEDPDLTLNQVTEEVGLPDEGPMSLLHSDEAISVTINFADTPSSQDIANVEQYAQVRRVLDVTPTIMGYVDALDLANLREVPGVVDVQVNLAPATAVVDKELTEEEKALLADAIGEAKEEEKAAQNAEGRAECRSIPAVANGPLKVTQARQQWGVDGTGVTVGIISDTYNEDPYAVTTAAEDVRAGLLPGNGNPCGYTQKVKVLNRGDAPDYLRNDEGRAMAQIVHGIAPGASLVVATIGQSQEETAQNIADLMGAGADVIVDDIFWSGEPNYQKGVISKQVDKAKASGIGYFTSSGNNNGVQAVKASSPDVGYPIGRHQSNKYVPTACPSWVRKPEGATKIDCLDFSPNGSGVPYGLTRGTVPQGQGYAWLGSFRHVLAWSEPVNGVKTSLQLQYYAMWEDQGTKKTCFGGASAAEDPSSPTRLALWTEAMNCTPMTQSGYDAALVVVRDISKSGYGSPQIQITPFSPSEEARPAWRQFYKTEGNNVFQGSQYGHDGDGSSWSVAAAPFYAPAVVENYSSLGSNEQWFEPVNGSKVSPALPKKVTPDVPVLLGLDGILTSFFGSPYCSMDGCTFGFYGTSAAAPTAAAVAALALEKDPYLSPDTLLQFMQETADKNVANPYKVSGTAAGWVTGAGLIDAQSFLTKVASSLSFSKIAKPVISGTPKVGNTLTVTKAGVSDFTPTADRVTYQWLKNGVAITGATGTTYKLVASDVGQKISVRATGIKSDYKNAQGTSATVTVQTNANKPTVTRLSGQNRYGTNDAVNKRFGVKGGPIFVATGADFADALSIGPAVGILKGTLFLTPRTSIDQKTLDQMKALSPSTVYVVGGTGAVSQGVASKIASATGKTPERIGGKTRYQTSEDIYKKFFASRAVPTAFVATGRDFPDALSSASAGAALGAPVLLVNGKNDTSLSAYLVNSLKEKKTSRVLISGGRSAVNQTIATNLAKSFTVERLHGADRYSTNAAVNAYVAKQAGSVDLTSVWVVTGRDFPDALSATAPSGKLSSRLVLSNGSCIPKPVVSSWLVAPGSKVSDVYLAGGTGVLKKSVANLTECK